MNPNHEALADAPANHPVKILMTEHKEVLKIINQLAIVAQEGGGEIGMKLTKAVADFKSAAKHYLREENVLFPLMEKHGITGPPAQMWAEHDKIRDLEKKIFGAIHTAKDPSDSKFLHQLASDALALQELLEMHYHKEDTILFPMAMKVLSDNEWLAVSGEFNDIGFCTFSPSVAGTFAVKSVENSAPSSDGMIDMGSGKLSLEELTNMLNNLPVEVTFVDANDTFRYFNKTKDPVFVRTMAAVGLQVQQCHPQKSVHLVNQILSEFKAGTRDTADFRINMGEKFVYIRYFAIRNNDGKYLGSMEIVQDIKEIQQLEGDKRL